MPMEQSARKSALRIALTFFIVTALLTLLYHMRESAVTGSWDPRTLDLGDLRTIPWHQLLTAVRGGLLFAGVTACLIYYLLSRELLAREWAEKQRSEALAEMEKLATTASRQARELDAIFRSIADAVEVYDTSSALVNANPAAVELLGIESGDSSCLDSHRPCLVHYPEGDMLAVEDLPVARALRGETVRGERVTHLSCKAGPRVMEITAAPLVDKGIPYGAVQVWHDVTEREHLLAEMEQRVRERTRELQEANRLLEARVAERTREFATLLAISRNLTSALELRPLLDEILDQLRVVVAYDIGAVIAQQGDSLVMLSYRGELPAEQAYATQFGPAAWRAYQAVSKARETLIVADVQMGGRLAEAIDEVIDVSGNTLLTATHAWLCVPIVIRERMIAVLCLGHSTPSYYAKSHARLAQAIANQAAVVIDNARLYLEGLRAATLDERQRLARELHDSIYQSLYGIALAANTARELISHDPNQVAPVLDDLVGLAEGSLSEMRALIFELRPESLEREGLVPALGRLASAVQARHHIPVFTDLTVEPALSVEDKENIYRIAQEALHNVAKHARRAGRSTAVHR